MGLWLLIVAIMEIAKSAIYLWEGQATTIPFLILFDLLIGAAFLAGYKSHLAFFLPHKEVDREKSTTLPRGNV